MLKHVYGVKCGVSPQPPLIVVEDGRELPTCIVSAHIPVLERVQRRGVLDLSEEYGRWLMDGGEVLDLQGEVVYESSSLGDAYAWVVWGE
jgi:hypothetical protein